MDVVEHEGGRAAVADHPEQVAQGAVQPPSLGGRLGRVAVPTGSPPREHPRQLPVVLLAQAPARGRGHPREGGGERVDHRHQRHVALQLGGPPLQHHEAAGPQALAERPQQGGLADAGLAAQHNHAAPAAGDRGHGAREGLQLPVAPVQMDPRHEARLAEGSP